MDKGTLGGDRFGYEDDVYGSCSCGETKRHHHHGFVPVTRHSEVADLMAEGVTLYRRMHQDHDCCDECDSLDAERRETEEYVFGQPRSPDADAELERQMAAIRQAERVGGPTPPRDDLTDEERVYVQAFRDHRGCPACGMKPRSVGPPLNRCADSCHPWNQTGEV